MGSLSAPGRKAPRKGANLELRRSQQGSSLMLDQKTSLGGTAPGKGGTGKSTSKAKQKVSLRKLVGKTFR